MKAATKRVVKPAPKRAAKKAAKKASPFHFGHPKRQKEEDKERTKQWELAKKRR
jgi:hypothetical protein